MVVNKMLFFKLINSSFKRNLKIYLPYLTASSILVAINYIFLADKNNQSLKKLSTGDVTSSLMDVGSNFVILVTLAFMLYVNHFLWQQRRQEMGLYSMLGMTRKNLRRLTVIEKGYLLVISLVAGLVGGIIFERLAFLGLARLLAISHLTQSWLVWPALGKTCLIIVVFFIVLMLIDLVKLTRLKATELWHPQKQLHKDHHRLFTLVGILGIVALASAYYLTLTVKPKMSAINTFMFAVILVVIGTYALFIAGSIIILKLLQKRQRFYYQPRHFIAVSGMLQRMQQNGASLATICLLCSSVLVILFSSITLYVGIDSVVKDWAPRDINITTSTSLTKQQITTIKRVADQSHVKLGPIVSFPTSAPQFGYWQGQHFVDQGSLEKMNNDTSNSIIMLSAQTCQRLTGKTVNLKNNEILTYSPPQVYQGKISIGHHQYQAKSLRHFDYYINPDHAIFSPIFVVANRVPTEMGQMTISCFNYSTTASSPRRAKFELTLQNHLQVANLNFTGRAYIKNQLTSLYGGLVFIGILMSMTLGVTTVVVIYFKQITEGYEDRQRFKTMQEVGLSKQETTKSIHSQVLMVFMLPVIGAIVNLAFAIPGIKQILQQLGFYNSQIMLTTAISITVSLLFLYLIIYALTTHVYRQIVNQR